MCSHGPAPAVAAKKPAEDPWHSLFDGKTLDQWNVTKFGGEGEVHVEDGNLILEMGSSATGVTLQTKFPKVNYEVTLEAMRVDGIDFFCGLTFPVADSHCSFIVGGWSGGVVGLSCLDYFDASENETTRFAQFEKGRWYKIRVRVTDKKIEAWIDDESYVDVETTDRVISIRPEMELSKPFGIASWETKAALRNLKYRKLPAK
jgi:hypothetical protein